MSKFGATHEWLVDGITLPVLVDGGEVYDRAHYWAFREGRPGVASVEVVDYDANGREQLVVRVGGKIRGTIRAQHMEPADTRGDDDMAVVRHR